MDQDQAIWRLNVEDVWQLPQAVFTPEEIRQAPVSFSWAFAARAWGLSKNKADQLRQAGEFPCKVTQLGPRSILVRRADLMESLGILEVGAAPAAAPTALAG